MFKLTRIVIGVAVAMAVGTSASAATPGAGRQVLCTTFPMYQIARNVMKGQDHMTPRLMLPAQLGCPHDYALTPDDMRKLAEADVLVVNGLGMEEFLGAPIKKANPKIAIIDSSNGIGDLLAYTGNEERAEHPFEWAGAFDLGPGVYRWSLASVDGKYADPTMKTVALAANAQGEEAIEATEAKAANLFAGDGKALKSGETARPEALYALQFDPASSATTFQLAIDRKGVYVLFAEHHPSEFGGCARCLTDAAGHDIAPVAEEPGGGHHHHHSGTNPHLFVSPRMSAKLAINIAVGLAKVDPDGAKIYARNAAAYAKTMNALADEFAALGKRLKNNRVVQPHGVFDYLARDMGLEIVATLLPHGQEPSAAEMIKIVNIIGEKKPGVILSEPQYPEKIGRTLAKETGVATATLDPGTSGPENAPLNYYEALARENMRVLKATLGIK